VYVDGAFVHYGPARAAEGYIRKDVLELPSGEICIAVLVNGYNVNNYYVNKESPRFGANVFRGENCIAGTDDFRCYEVTDMFRNTQRYANIMLFILKRQRRRSMALCIVC
jgi:hypothetical protein